MGKKNPKSVDVDFDKNPQELLKYLDLALEGANLGIWDWYLDDNSVRFDRRWAEMLGLDHEEIDMELKTWESRVHPDDLEKCYGDIKAYMDGKTDYYENIHRMKHADGHWVYILDRGRFSDWDKDGKPIRFTGTHFDITKSERYRKKLAIFFEESPFGYAFCDMEGNLLEINDRYAEITGYNLEELKQLSYWDITPRKYEADEAKQIESMEKTGRYGPYRKEYIRKDGQIIPVELNGFIIEDYDGVKGIWSTVEDISEKRMLESQLVHSSKLASIGVLAAGVGHEINNPLAVIKGQVERLMLTQPENTEVQACATKVNKAIDRISNIVVGLRTFSRSDSSKFESFNVHSALNDSVSLMKDILESEGISVHVSIDENTQVPVKGSRGKVQQVFMNLITNAKDASTGQVERNLTIETSVTDEHSLISISDNGVGIPESELEKIFDPFYTTKNVNEGTGIGLSIAHSIVSDHDGEIRVKSEQGKGTEFIIQLPISTSSVEEDMQPIHPNVTSLKTQQGPLDGHNVILADDEPEILELTGFYLESLGAKVFPFPNGQEAFEAFKAEPEKFGIIVSDMKMPKMDGDAFLKAVRGLKNIPQPKFVFVTGGVGVDLEAYNENNDEQIDGFFYKPFDRAKIEEVLTKALGSKAHKKAAS